MKEYILCSLFPLECGTHYYLQPHCENKTRSPVRSLDYGKLARERKAGKIEERDADEKDERDQETEITERDVLKHSCLATIQKSGIGVGRLSTNTFLATNVQQI